MSKNIVLIDDHAIIRDALKELIPKLGSYKIVGDFANGRHFLDALPLDPVPDLLIIDIGMPEIDGEGLVDAMLSLGLQMPILILTLSHDENRIIRLFRKGIKGYIEKNSNAAIMRMALEQIFSFGYYHNEMMKFALENSGNTAKTKAEKVLDELSTREIEFLKLVCDAEEYTYEQIADKMCVSARSVDGYRAALFERYGIKSKAGLVLFAIKYGLFRPSTEMH